MQLPSPAKLNLFLHIIGQREDGYHELQTVFQFIDLCDTLDFSLTENRQITISPEINNLPLHENLIYRAAELLIPFKSSSAFGVDIFLEKQLPMGGGIGGGSSNAATTLLALNILWECHLPLETLAELGVKLGADIPIFVMGFSAFAEGVGEKLHKVEPATPFYLLLKPNCHVPTGQIFTDKYLTRDTPPIKIPHDLMPQGKNDCLETVIKHFPEIHEAYFWLKNHGDAKLTGTGACLFIAFENKQDAERLKAVVPKKWQTWVCCGCNTSPTHHALNQWIEKKRN